MLAWTVSLLILVSSVLAPTASDAQSPPERSVEVDTAPMCAGKSLCREMATCAEAVHYLTACGVASLDRDGDGIPCETACGKTLDVMAARVAAQPVAAPWKPARARAGLLGSVERAAPQAASGFVCGAKRTCRQMTSCQEATFHLTTCGVRSLDGNSDGVACNGLCR